MTREKNKGLEGKIPVCEIVEKPIYIPVNVELGLNFDNPTDKETLEHQRMAEDIQLQEIVGKYDIKQTQKLLARASHVGENDYYGMADWLETAGYNGVNVPGKARVPFKEALPRYRENVYRMFQKETARLRRDIVSQ